MIKLIKLLKTAAFIIFGLLFLSIIIRLIPYKDLNNFLNQPYSVEIQDRNEKPIYILPLKDGLRQEFTPIENIPKEVQYIFLKSEDKRFYFHYGVDIFALIRTLVLNVTYKRRISGASTITMQLARIISPHSKQGYSAKIIEILRAIQLESKLTKKKILELYLNSLPYGYNTKGITSAARKYFNANLENLSSDQKLMLAIIPRNPTLYNPFNNSEKLVNAINILQNRIPKIKKSSNNTIPQSSYDYTNKAPHFINYFKSVSNSQIKNGVSPIISSLDLEINSYAQDQLKHHLKRNENKRIANGAVYGIDNYTGEIILYLGSQDFFDLQKQGNIDGVFTTFQPGSTLKPFLYALGIENGFLPSTILPDLPLDFGENEVYVPLNFNNKYHGPIRLRIALASSLNIPAVYMITRLGVQNFADFLISLNFNSIIEQKSYLGSGLALGNAEISLYELTNGFSTFSRSGQLINPIVIKNNSRTFIEGEQGLSKYTSFIITNILSDNTSRVLGFGIDSVLKTDFPMYIKTGTSNQYNHIWAVGATTEYTIGVWMGNFTGETVIGKTGSSTPAQIVIRILKELNSVNQPKEFTKPDNLKRVNICPVSGDIATILCNGQIEEYFKEGETLTKCKHNETDINFNTSIISKSLGLNNSNPQFFSPNNNSIYYLNPNVDEEQQQIMIKVLNPNSNSPVDIYLNNEFLDTLKYPYTKLIPMKEGTHTITINNQNGEDLINIRVIKNY